MIKVTKSIILFIFNYKSMNIYFIDLFPWNNPFIKIKLRPTHNVSVKRRLWRQREYSSILHMYTNTT